MTTAAVGGAGRVRGHSRCRAGKPVATRECQEAAFFAPLHPRPSALLLVALVVACEEKIVIVELSQLAVEALVALDFWGSRKDTATFGVLKEKKMKHLLGDLFKMPPSKNTRLALKNTPD